MRVCVYILMYMERERERGRTKGEEERNRRSTGGRKYQQENLGKAERDFFFYYLFNSKFEIISR